MATPLILVIRGQLSSGKSSLARTVLDRFRLGLHVDVDAIREMVTSGRASPLDWTDETTHQFELAVSASVALARIYREAGYAVVIEGAMHRPMVEKALADGGLENEWIGIDLHPRLEVALHRNRQRRTKPFNTSILEQAMRDIDVGLTREPSTDAWTRLDNSDETVEQTADRIFALWRRASS